MNTKKLILLGDFNIDLLKYSIHQETTDFLDEMIIRNLIPHITSPTRVTHNTATLIDHIFSNIPTENVVSGTLRTDISDHYSNFIILKSVLSKVRMVDTVSYRVMNNSTIENLDKA